MAAILSIFHSFKLEAGGQIWQGRQGQDTDLESEPLELSVADDPFTGAPAISGYIHHVRGTLATGAGVTIWDEDDDAPADWIFMWVKLTQAAYVQLIGQTSQVSVKLYPYLPFNMQGNKILAAANTTALAAEPTLEEVDSVRLWNQSGNTMYYQGGFVY